MIDKAADELLAEVLSAPGALHRSRACGRSPTPPSATSTRSSRRWACSATSGSPASSSSPPPARCATTSARSSSSSRTRSGVSTLVEMITHDGVDGQHGEHRARAVLRARLAAAGRSARRCWSTTTGDRVVIRGTVTDIDGTPVAGATLDCWQNATAGFYAVPAARRAVGREPPGHLRDRRRRQLRDPHRAARAVPDPVDGPVGDLLKANGRDWMRPGHTHMWVRATRLQGRSSPTCSTSRATTSTTTPSSACATASCGRFAPTSNGELATTFDVVLDRA